MYNHKTNYIYQNKFQFYFIVLYLECIWQYKQFNRHIYISSIWNLTHIYLTVTQALYQNTASDWLHKKTAQIFFMWNVLLWYHISFIWEIRFIFESKRIIFLSFPKNCCGYDCSKFWKKEIFYIHTYLSPTIHNKS